jgi:hypothetical protein
VGIWTRKDKEYQYCLRDRTHVDFGESFLVVILKVKERIVIFV